MHRWLAAATLAFIVACAAPPPDGPPSPAVAPAAQVEPPPAGSPPPIDLDRLDALLTQGDEALKEDRLLTPIDDSAYDHYSAALSLAPDHPAALAGLDKLVDRYVTLATDATQRGQYARARNLLERAKFIKGDHEGIPLVEARIDRFEHAARNRVPLDAAALSARSPELASRLAALGALAKQEHTWVTISARNDAEGRWIYQQLRKAPGEHRIRAELVIAGAPSVEIFDFATKSEAP